MAQAAVLNPALLEKLKLLAQASPALAGAGALVSPVVAVGAAGIGGALAGRAIGRIPIGDKTIDERTQDLFLKFMERPMQKTVTLQEPETVRETFERGSFKPTQTLQQKLQTLPVKLPEVEGLKPPVEEITPESIIAQKPQSFE